MVKKSGEYFSYLERDLDGWTQQLRQLTQRTFVVKMEKLVRKTKSTLTTAIQHRWQSIGFETDRNAVVFGLNIFFFYAILLVHLRTHLTTRPEFTSPHGPIQFMEQGRVAIHNGVSGVPGSFRIDEYFSSDVHHIQFSIEKISSSSHVFIGVISQTEKVTVAPRYGWWMSDGRIEENQSVLASFFSRVTE